jgi:Pin2-interacting protein X1
MKSNPNPNPRGKIWSEDKNKYGQRLMEKMGWSSGKGLGLDETGVTEPVLVRFKNDKKGLGQKGLSEDINPHLQEFDSFLTTLNKQQGAVTSQGTSQESNSKGLEERARSCKKLFYHRFIKSKDVSRYSEKDMKCIFGSQSEKMEESRPVEQFTEGADGEVSSSHGTTTVHRGSMNDYFAEKMAKKGKKLSNKDITTTEEQTSSDKLNCLSSESYGDIKSKLNKNDKKKKNLNSSTDNIEERSEKYKNKDKLRENMEEGQEEERRQKKKKRYRDEGLENINKPNSVECQFESDKECDGTTHRADDYELKKSEEKQHRRGKKMKKSHVPQR